MEQQKEKQMDKKKVILIPVIGLLVFFGLAAFFFFWQYPRMQDFGTAGIFTQEETERTAEEVIALISAQEYDQVLTEYAGKAFRGDVEAEDLEYMAIGVSPEWGDFVQIKSCVLGEMKKAGSYYALAEVEVSYELVDVIFTFSFDREMKLAGVYMQQKAAVQSEAGRRVYARPSGSEKLAERVPERALPQQRIF